MFTRASATRIKARVSGLPMVLSWNDRKFETNEDGALVDVTNANKHAWSNTRDSNLQILSVIANFASFRNFLTVGFFFESLDGLVSSYQ